MLDVPILLVLIIPLKFIPYLGHESLPISIAARARLAEREQQGDYTPYPFCLRSIFAQVSRNVAVRLKTSFSGFESGSTQK